MRGTCKLFAKGLSTGYKVLDEFSSAVIEGFPNASRLPSVNDCEATAQFMYAERGMPGCIGALDGKHFAVAAGADDNISFRNYKGFRSLTVLAMANHVYKFTWIGDIWPGISLHSPHLYPHYKYLILFIIIIFFNRQLI